MKSPEVAGKLAFPALPISPSLPGISQALQENHLVLSAPPGSGKTTLVPLALLDAKWLHKKKIIMLEPRRPAARMAARRMASLLNEAVGEQVGYQVRFDRKISKNTRIEVLTEGLLLRRLQQDPELNGVGLVIFDEFHERSLVADLSLALCIDSANALRDDLRLLLMSASMDTDVLADKIGAKTFYAKGQSHPVKVYYAERDSSPHELITSCHRLIHLALTKQEGDVLVFLPGKGEIHRLQHQLHESLDSKIDILSLHGELPAKEQDIILNGDGKKRRIILSTDIAETSLTIEGIGIVVDAGFNRKPSFDANSGLSRLETRPISQASALQRTGRAGRLGPGTCYRAWTEARQQRLEKNIKPEILEADLAPLVLELANWGVSQISDLHWVDAPPAAHWAQAVDLLKQLGAINNHTQITGMGKAMVRLPTHPRLAHMLLSMPNKESQQLAADIAALLSDRDPIIRQQGEPSPADIELRIQALQAFRDTGNSQGYDKSRLAQLNRLAGDFIRNLVSIPARTSQLTLVNVGNCLALAFPDRIAMARIPGQTGYLLRNGRGVTLNNQDSLMGSPFMVCASLDAGSREGRIWLGAAIELITLENLFEKQIVHQRRIVWDNKRNAVSARQEMVLGAICLATKSVALLADDDITGLLIKQVNAIGLDLFNQATALRQFQAKIKLLRENLGEDHWPDFSDEKLLQTPDEWLLPWLDNCSTLKQLKAVDVIAALKAHLGWQATQQLEEMLPEYYKTPAGSRRAIEYSQDLDPVLRVPLQEMLGEQQTPRIANGNIALTLHLLSPARRPLQVTQDLENFWRTAYTEVKKEMRGRYPKHHWPDDPASAQATRFTKRRR